MTSRLSRIDEATRRAERQLASTTDDLIQARRMAGLSQASVARALGVSRALVSQWEQRRVVPGVVQTCRWAAALGVDVSIRTFPSDGEPLRDAGQLRLLDRFHRLIGESWSWRTEVACTADPRDRRAFDAVLDRDAAHVAVEAVSRLIDAQAQVRPILAKQAASGIACVVLVLADTRHNRAALAVGAPTLNPAFPCHPREALASLRAGEAPRTNAIVFA